MTHEEHPPPPLQDPPTRQNVIPALERHILTSDLKGTIEHLRNYNKRPGKHVTMVTEDLARVSRNEGICNRMRDWLLLKRFKERQAVVIITIIQNIVYPVYIQCVYCVSMFTNRVLIKSNVVKLLDTVSFINDTKQYHIFL